MLHLVLAGIANQFLEDDVNKVIFMSQVKYMSGSQPDKHPNKLRGQAFHHFAFKFADVDLAELKDMIEDVLRQFCLVIFQQIYK